MLEINKVIRFDDKKEIEMYFDKRDIKEETYYYHAGHSSYPQPAVIVKSLYDKILNGNFPVFLTANFRDLESFYDGLGYIYKIASKEDVQSLNEYIKNEQMRKESNMNISFYEDVDIPKTKSIFLAGPTIRNGSFEDSWRKEAVRLLEEAGFDGNVFVPESKTGDYRMLAGKEFDAPIWEWTALDASDIILFWIPRDLEKLPAFTTNVEFGRYTALVPEKVVLGFPKEAPKNKYLEKLYLKTCNRTPTYTLENTIKSALEQLKNKEIDLYGDIR